MNKPHIKWWINLIIWIIAFELLGFLLGLLTEANIDPWYNSLNKSILTPPGIVFSIVWSLLYAFLAIIGVILFKHKSDIHFNNIFNLFSLQMLMNWAWTPLFFELKWIGFSFFWLLILAGLNGLIIFKLRKQSTGLTILLLPYFFWLLFATYLNGIIWLLN